MTNKEIFCGEKSRFAFKITFRPDPDLGSGVTPEEAISWGGFELWVEGRNLCVHRENETIIEDANWYLLPMLEWLSAGWDYLLHEERLPLRVGGDDGWHSLKRTSKPPPTLADYQENKWYADWQCWWQRHSLLACRQGGFYPDVVFRRWRDRIEISWGPRRLAGQPSYFDFLINDGFARLPVENVAETLYDALGQAADYLAQQDPESDRLANFRDGLVSLRQNDSTHRLALLAGLGDSPDEVQSRWSQINTQLLTKPDAAASVLHCDGTDLFLAGSCQAALMFGSVSPTLGNADVMALANGLLDYYSPASESPLLRELVKDLPIINNAQRPWAQGYSLAETVLEQLELPAEGATWINVQEIYNRLGIDEATLKLDDTGIRAVSLAGPDHKPSVLLNPNHMTFDGESGRRFTLAHELCHILFDRSYGARLAIASGPWAPRDVEQRANAFAAMLLMPTELIQTIAHDLPVRLASVQGVRELSSRLRTSRKATLDHLKNTSMLTPEEHERIEWEMDGHE